MWSLRVGILIGHQISVKSSLLEVGDLREMKFSSQEDCSLSMTTKVRGNVCYCTLERSLSGHRRTSRLQYFRSHVLSEVHFIQYINQSQELCLKIICRMTTKFGRNFLATVHILRTYIQHDFIFKKRTDNFPQLEMLFVLTPNFLPQNFLQLINSQSMFCQYPYIGVTPPLAQ